MAAGSGQGWSERSDGSQRGKGRRRLQQPQTDVNETTNNCANNDNGHDDKQRVLREYMV